MPCNSSEGMGDAYREDPVARRQLEAMKKELDTVTQILCAVCRCIEGSGEVNLPQEARVWYRKHKEWDKSQGR